jgi:integral membrane sensor domain MASE1
VAASAGLALCYFVAAKLGLKLAFLNASATAVWPPTGIALAAVLLLGPRIWPGVFVGAFLANMTTAGTVVTSLGIAIGNTLEAVVGAYLVNRFAGGRGAFDRAQNIFRFVLLAAWEMRPGR